MNPTERALEDMFNLWNGIGLHNQFQDVMGKEYAEKKEVLIYKDISIVAKADYLPPEYPDEVWEIKTSDKIIEPVRKPWFKTQTKFYCTIFNKPVALIYQPLQDDNGIYLKHIDTVQRDDKWVEEQLEKLYNFHLRLEKLWENQK
jgi:hypothetical protein